MSPISTISLRGIEKEFDSALAIFDGKERNKNKIKLNNLNMFPLSLGRINNLENLPHFNSLFD
jgi:hypothetical protein